MDRRTEAQLAFDMAKHGWAFCNRTMLLGKIEQLEALAKELRPTDDRHRLLRTIKATVWSASDVKA